MNAPANLPFRRAAAVLAAYQRNVDDVLSWIDASWIAELLADTSYGDALQQSAATSSAGARARYSRALAAAAGIEPPAFEGLTHSALWRPAAGEHEPNVALLDALPAAHGLKVLRMRALLFRRAEVRRLIDKRTRSQLAEWVGVSVDRLTQDARLDEVPDITRLVVRTEMPPLAALDATALAIEGWVLLVRDLARSERANPRQVGAAPPFLLRLALPRALPAMPWLAAIPVELDALGSARLFARLAELLPEFIWLSG